MKTNNFKSVVRKIKEKKEGFFFSKIENIVEHYWSKWIDIRKNGYDVNIKNPDEVKTIVDFSSLKLPTSFKIENPQEIAEYIIIPKNEKFPDNIKVSNLSELAKLIKIEKVSIPKDFSIKNLKDIPKVEFPDNLKKLSLKKTEEVLGKLVLQLKKDKDKDKVFIKNKKPEEYIPVRIVDKRGNDWLESFGNAVMGFPNKIGLFNKAGESVDPATEAKQDDIISNTGARTDLEGSGYVTVGTTEVELTFTGTTNIIHLESKITNTGTIWIGKTGVTNAGANSYASLQAGESIDIPYNDSTNALYAISDTAAQSLLKGALL